MGPGTALEEREAKGASSRLYVAAVLTAPNPLCRHFCFQDWVENLGQTWRYVIVAGALGSAGPRHTATSWQLLLVRPRAPAHPH